MERPFLLLQRNPMGRPDRNFYRRSIPARRLKTANPKSIWWEDTMTTGRIMDVYDRLSVCLNSNQTNDRDTDFLELMTARRIMDLHDRLRLELLSEENRVGTAFLELLAEQNVTEKELKEVASISKAGRDLTMLLVATRNLDYARNLEPSLEVLRKLIDANPKTIFARGWRGGSIPLHTALTHNAPHAVIALLLNYDPSRSSLLMKGSDGDLPLHKGLKTNRTSNATTKLLLSDISETTKKEILDAKNNAGKTPIQVAGVHNPDTLPMLAEERIQLIPAGIPSWHGSLRDLVHRYQELDRSLRNNNRFRRDQFTSFFMTLFYETIADIETLVKQKPQEIALLQLAVWKGRGFDIDNGNNSKEERQARWITCGAHHIAHWVAAFLGPNPVPRLQAEYDRLIQINVEDIVVFLDGSDDEAVVIPARPIQNNNGAVIVPDSDDEN